MNIRRTLAYKPNLFRSTKTRFLNKLFSTQINMANVAVAICIAFIVTGIVKLVISYFNNLKFAKKFRGPGIPWPLVGHSLLFHNG